MSGKGVPEFLKRMRAILTGGHFVYTSGKHGSEYVNKDAIYRDPEATDEICRMIADHFRNNNVEVVVAPAVGGINLSQGVARHLIKMTGRMVVSIYADKEGSALVIKRGYENDVPGARVLVVDDVFTTGGSVKKLVEVVRALGGVVVGIGGLCNRGGVKAIEIGKGLPELFTLTSVQMVTYNSEECPLCKDDVPINVEVGKGKEYLAKKSHGGEKWKK